MNNIKLFVANYLLLIASEMELIILVDPYCFAYGPRATAMKKTEEVHFVICLSNEVLFKLCSRLYSLTRDTKANGLRKITRNTKII